MLKQVFSSIFSAKASDSSVQPESPKESDQVTVITSFHAAGFTQYGRAFVDSFERHWPSNFQLVIYAEDFIFETDSSRIQVLDLHSEIPALCEFKRRHEANPNACGQLRAGYDYLSSSASS